MNSTINKSLMLTFLWVTFYAHAMNQENVLRAIACTTVVSTVSYIGWWQFYKKPFLKQKLVQLQERFDQHLNDKKTHYAQAHNLVETLKNIAAQHKISFDHAPRSQADNPDQLNDMSIYYRDYFNRLGATIREKQLDKIQDAQPIIAQLEPLRTTIRDTVSKIDALYDPIKELEKALGKK